jgi:hypothetical protein
VGHVAFVSKNIKGFWKENERKRGLESPWLRREINTIIQYVDWTQLA